MPHQNTVFVIIPVFQRLEKTISCIQQLKVQTHKSLQIIVSDGGSKDGSPDKIANMFHDIVLLRTEKELWWGEATEVAVSYALSKAQKNDYILFMNDDTHFAENYIESLLQLSQELDACVGALTVDYCDTTKILDAGEFIDWEQYRFPVRDTVPAGAKYCDTVDFLPGRGSLVPIKVFDKVGNIKGKRFPHYLSDYDFFARVKKAGFKLVISYETKILSDTQATGVICEDNPKMGFKKFVTQHFSIRSMGRVFDHYRFITDHAPNSNLRNKHLQSIIKTTALRALYLLPGGYRTYCLCKIIKRKFKTALKLSLQYLPNIHNPK